MAVLCVREVAASQRLFYCKNIINGTRAPGLFRKVGRLSEMAVIAGLTAAKLFLVLCCDCHSIFHRILDSLGTFLDTVDLATVNTTNNLTTLTFNTYAVQIQEVDPDNFAGQTFVVNLGPVEQAMNISGNIAQESLITLDGVAIDNSRRKRQSTGLDVQNATASLQLTPLIFENCVSNMSSEASTIVSQRLSYSVFVSDVLFQTENNIKSNIVVGSIVVAVRLRCQLANKTMLSVPVRSTFQVAEMVAFVC